MCSHSTASRSLQVFPLLLLGPRFYLPLRRAPFNLKCQRIHEWMNERKPRVSWWTGGGCWKIFTKSGNKNTHMVNDIRGLVIHELIHEGHDKTRKQFVDVISATHWASSNWFYSLYIHHFCWDQGLSWCLKLLIDNRKCTWVIDTHKTTIALKF